MARRSLVEMSLAVVEWPLAAPKWRSERGIDTHVLRRGSVNGSLYGCVCLGSIKGERPVRLRARVTGDKSVGMAAGGVGMGGGKIVGAGAEVSGGAKVCAGLVGIQVHARVRVIRVTVLLVKAPK